MKCQAYVLSRQQRRAYIEMLSNTTIAQAYIKRFLAMHWYRKIREKKDGLVNHINTIDDMI